MNNNYYYNTLAFFLISALYCTNIETHAPSLASFKHKSAAVLPIFKQKNNHALSKLPINSCSDTSDVWVLLMREVPGKSGGGTYAPASGKAEKGETALETAAHEAFEEMIIQKTMHKSLKQMEHYLQPRHEYNHTRHIIVYDRTKKNISKNVTYVTEFDYYINDIHNKFYPALAKAKKAAHAAKKKYSAFTEKDYLAYVKWDDLQKIIVDNPGNNHLDMEAFVVNPKTLKLKKERITLRPFFVLTIRGFFEGRTYTAGKEPKVRFYYD